VYIFIPTKYLIGCGDVTICMIISLSVFCCFYVCTKGAKEIIKFCGKKVINILEYSISIPWGNNVNQCSQSTLNQIIRVLESKLKYNFWLKQAFFKLSITFNIKY